MTMLNKQGVLMDKWFKSPNAIIDDITGDVVSPQAAIVLCSILRLTEGVRGRNWASIPHSFFMRKTRTKRRETIGKYIDELIENELINVNKSNGKVTEYAINWRSKLWYSLPALEQKTASTVPVRFISTSTFEPYIPVRFIRTGSWETSTFHPYTYKDIKTKDNSKDKKSSAPAKKTKANPPVKKKTTIDKPSELSQQIWDDLLTLRKSKRAPLTQTAWTPIANQIADIQQKTGHSLDQIVTVWVTRAWTAIKAEWYLNHIKNDQPQQTNYQGNNHANHQSANSQPNHFDQLRAEARAKYGNTQPNTGELRTVN